MPEKKENSQQQEIDTQVEAQMGKQPEFADYKKVQVYPDPLDDEDFDPDERVVYALEDPPGSYFWQYKYLSVNQNRDSNQAEEWLLANILFLEGEDQPIGLRRFSTESPFQDFKAYSYMKGYLDMTLSAPYSSDYRIVVNRRNEQGEPILATTDSGKEVSVLPNLTAAQGQAYFNYLQESATKALKYILTQAFKLNGRLITLEELPKRNKNTGIFEGGDPELTWKVFTTCEAYFLKTYLRPYLNRT
jgi:hypothetical protein